MMDNQFEDNVEITPPPVPSEELDMQQEAIPPLKPSNWVWLSVLVTLCCFPIFGIIGLVNGMQVNPNYYAFNYERAERFSRRARLWSVMGIVVGLINIIVMVVSMTKGNMLDGISQIVGDGVYSIYNY